MYNLYDYLTWRGDLSFRQVPFNDFDALMLACAVYVDVGDACRTDEGTPLFELGHKMAGRKRPNRDFVVQCDRLLQQMLTTPRWRNAVFSNYVDILDGSRQMQFAALCCDIPGVGRVLSFRGTDNTLIGWREDFAMSYETVPSQNAALAYTEACAGISALPLYIVGHSKGGNLATYAAATARPEIQRRLVGAWSFDGPGLNDELIASEGYRNVLPRLHALIPESSIIGLLMGANPTETIIRSSAAGIQQHNVFTWGIIPPDKWDRAEKTTLSSQIIDRTLHDWLRQATPAQRRDFMDAMFDVLESTGASTTKEMKASLIPQLPHLAKAAGNIDPQTGQMILRLTGQLIGLSAANSLDLSIAPAIARAAETAAGFIQSKLSGLEKRTEKRQESAAETAPAAETALVPLITVEEQKSGEGEHLG